MSERPRFWSKQSLTEGARFAGVLTFLLAVFVALIFLWAVTTPGNLPRDVDTLGRFQKRMPHPEQIWLRNVQGRDVFVVIGPRDIQSLSFGPPLYIFDRRGRLLSWVYDAGDDADNFQLWAYTAKDGKLLTMDDALELIGQEKNAVPTESGKR
jgi:hypothetical protein